jgi:hypothetical protein
VRGQGAKLRGVGGNVDIPWVWLLAKAFTTPEGGYDCGESLCIGPHHKWALTTVNLSQILSSPSVGFGISERVHTRNLT